jgi:hypothetical protein
VQKQYSAKVSMVAKSLWLCLLTAQQSTKLLMQSNRVPVHGIFDRSLFPATPFQSSSTFSSSSFGCNHGQAWSLSLLTAHHLMHAQQPPRIHWQVLQGLQKCLYHYNSKDKKMVIQALVDGTMNGKKHSEGEIGELKDSLKWNRHYCAFLQKLSTQLKGARIEMHEWWNRNKVEGGSGPLHK